MSTREKQTPDWLVERLALGELDAAAAADVRRRLAAEGRDADAELAALATSSREILEAHPPALVAAAVRARDVEARPTRGWFFALPLVLAGAVAVGLVARPATHGAAPRSEGDVVFENTTIKGATALHVYRRVADRNERLHDGSPAARGDLLQLAYVAADESKASDYGAVLSIDGGGHVTVHLPEGDAATSARLSAKGEVRLPSAYELDDAPAFERFILVTSPAPFSMATVVEAARAVAAHPADARAQKLVLPASMNQLSLALDKTRQERSTP
jgi:hypothetical protein